ncbi:MAG TPA: DUF4043 family protein [Allosphingosinicella sp.]|nr:DUF4043 family protein [Allosphingosinicella sp.]
MSDFVLAKASEKQVWDANFAREYIRDSSLLPYMGTGATSIFRVRNDLLNTAGAVVHFPLIARTRGNGVTGTTALVGSEADMPNYSCGVRVIYRRQAHRFHRGDTYRTEMDLMNAAKANLVDWSAGALRDRVLAQLASVVVKGADASDGTPGEDSTVAWGSATEAQKDAYLDKNTDRILFGALDSNLKQTAPAGGATNDMSKSLEEIDNTADKLTAALILKAKRKAKTAGSASGSMHIAPFKSDMTNGREYYVLFVDSNGFRDLGNDASIIAANTNARAREGSGMDSNPLFQDGDLLYQGIIIRECPELAAVGAVGASAIQVGNAFLCGQSAVAIAWGQKPKSVIDITDYQARQGVGVEEISGEQKVSFNGVQYGVVTIFHASVNDA